MPFKLGVLESLINKILASKSFMDKRKQVKVLSDVCEVVVPGRETQ